MRQSCTLVESPLAWLSQDRRAMHAQFGFFRVGSLLRPQPSMLLVGLT